MLEVRRRARCGAKCRRIERASPRGKKEDPREAAADLESMRAEVPVRKPVARDVESRPKKECGEPRAAGGSSRSACRHVEGNYHAPYLAESPQPFAGTNAAGTEGAQGPSEARRHDGVIHRVQPAGRSAALRAAVARRRRHVSLPPASRCAAPLASSAVAASVTSSAYRNASPSSHRRRARRYPWWRCYCGCRIQSESGLREAPSLRVREVAREVFTWLTES